MNDFKESLERIIGWHLELTRRCSLSCPACPRTFDRNGIENLNQDLSLEDIKTFFRPEELPHIKYIFLQGNLGDPIYHPQFHEISEHFFSAQHLAVTTNGMKTKPFWERVFKTWPENSLITLSIDGLEETNHIYRVNSRWNLIQDLFDVIANEKRKCKIQWKYLLFEHNAKDVEKAHDLSKKIGIDSFCLQKTRALNEKTNLGGQLKEYDGEYFSNETPKKYLDILSPFCKTKDMHYIDAHGRYFPCCWWSSYYSESKQRNNSWPELNIKNMSIEGVFEQFNNFAKTTLKYECAPQVCKHFCRKIENNKEDLSTPNSQLDRKFLGNSKKEWEVK